MNRRTFLSLAAAAAPAFPQAPKKRLMVHADDAGMCHSVNVATIKALTAGAVQSASIMMPCPWVSEMAAWARENTKMDLGLHLTLTSEWVHYKWRPIAAPAAVPGLLDPDGYLWRDVRSVATRATAQEVETELKAQIAYARKLGIAFTHFDTHMGTLYARPDYFEVYTKLAKQNQVPCMIPRPSPALKAEMAQYPITEQMLARKGEEGFPLLDRLVTGVPGRTVEERKASYRTFLRELQPGVTKLIVHLAMDDPEIRSVTNAWEQRWADFLFFTSDEARALMKELDIHPVTYRELGS
ncbi:MAG TPA: hypothetical protein DEH78_27105 [Solibacterales bacterium]|nr:hypothetical protein [Bryobacterales bacterium]